ncbi:MAG: hypothetical protein L0Y71_17255 [Gemmataceae bacterium]|nr:hypothetical protein [Gemmataceae bacterium]
MGYRSRLMGIATLLASVGLTMAATADDDGVKGKGKGKGKGGVVTVNLSTLPPGLAQQLLNHIDAAGKGAGKKGLAHKGKKTVDGEKKKGKAGDQTISLSQAIDIAERVGKGEAVKADRKGTPDGFQFKVDIIRSDGRKSKILLSGAGKVLREDAKGPGGPKAEKKKKKGD